MDGWTSEAATRRGYRSEPHHLQQASFVDQAHGVYAVVRGYGGQASGSFAVDTVCAELRAALDAGLGGIAAVTTAAARAGTQMRTRRDITGLTASLAALVVDGPRVVIASAGLCTAYRLRAGVLTRRSANHRMGEGSIVGLCSNRGVGIDDDRLDLVEDTVDAGDRYLLVNEAVVDVLTGDEILAVVSSYAQGAADRLVERVHLRDTQRHVTALVVDSTRPRERL